jgi:hypothetical protein
MQAAQSTSNWAALPFARTVAAFDREVVVMLVLAALDVVEVVVLLTDATLGLFELPPHPATRIALTSAAAASRRRRRERSSRVRCVLSCICLLLVSVGSAHRFYATRGYRKVSLLETAVRAARAARPVRHPVL